MRGAVRPEETDRPHPGWISFFFRVGGTHGAGCVFENE